MVKWPSRNVLLLSEGSRFGTTREEVEEGLAVGALTAGLVRMSTTVALILRLAEVAEGAVVSSFERGRDFCIFGGLEIEGVEFTTVLAD